MKRTRKYLIKKYCFECSGNSYIEVTICPVINCPLWWYRMGGEADSPSCIKRVQNNIANYPEIFKQWKDSGVEAKLLKKIESNMQQLKKENKE